MRGAKLGVVAAIGLAMVGCDVSVDDGSGGEQCLDEFLAELGEDRSSIEAEAEARGIEASAVITELYEGAVGVADVLFDCSARESLQQLAGDSGGTYYEVGDASEIPDAIIEHNQSIEASSVDIVFLIDATGSMSGEIDAVKKKLATIIDALDGEVRLSVSTYRDNNVDDPWYETSGGMVGGTTGPKDFLADARATGGGDIAESLFDGIVEVIDTKEWTGDARLIVAVTDAPPLMDGRTNNKLNDVISACADSQVAVVPVLVGIR